jgi:hypothetical protein
MTFAAMAALAQRGEAQVSSASPSLRRTAKTVIFVNLQGAPSHVDTFDPKDGPWLPSDANLQRNSGGIVLSKTFFPEFSALAGDLCIMRSIQSWELAHDRGQFYLLTAHQSNPAFVAETPNMGSVAAFELGTPGPLPAFLSLNGNASQGATFLSGLTEPTNAPANPGGLTTIQHNYFGATSQQRFEQKFAFLTQLDAEARQANLDKSLADHASFYDSAKKLMYDPLVSAVFQFSTDDQNRYGNTSFGNACLVARNAVRAQAGTSFITLNLGGWDTHQNMFDRKYTGNMYQLCGTLDRGVGELVQDLKASGHLSSTLIVVMGEFGRTPGPLNVQGGRDHHKLAMSAVMIGGGVKGGRIIGASDSIGYDVIDPGWSAKRPIVMEDVACTIYSALGIDYTKGLTDTPSGRRFEYVNKAGTGLYTSVDEVFG